LPLPRRRRRDREGGGHGGHPARRVGEGRGGHRRRRRAQARDGLHGRQALSALKLSWGVLAAHPPDPPLATREGIPLRSRRCCLLLVPFSASCLFVLLVVCVEGKGYPAQNYD